MSRKMLKRAAKKQDSYQDSPDHSDDAGDSPTADLLSILMSLQTTKRKSNNGRKSTKRRKTSNCTCNDHCKYPSVSPKISKKNSPAKKRSTKTTKVTTILINSDSEEEKADIEESHLKNIENKIDTFFKLNLLSDDDNDEDLKLNQNKVEAKSKDFYTVLSDSDNECKVEKSLYFDCIPGTSGVNNDIKSNIDNKNKDDGMEILNQIFELRDDQLSESITPEVSIEEYKKKTEEMLGSVSALIDGFKKKDDKQKGIPKDEKSSLNVMPLCPICLEPFANKETSSTFCGHIFCHPCIKQVAKTTKRCPTCRKAITLKKIHPIYF